MESSEDKAAHDKMYRIPFGMISAMGSIHNALFSKGDVYQIHWDANSSSTGTPDTDSLYEKSSFLEFAREHWRSGIIAAPPGQDIPRKAP